MAADLLRFLSLMTPAQQAVTGLVVAGFWSSRSWFTVWNGKAWLPARQLTSDQAREWQIDQFEAMGARQPLGNIQLWRWTGSAWQRAA